MTVRTWNGSAGAFGDAADWSPTGVPVAGDVARIDSGAVTIGASDLADNVSLVVGQSGPVTLTVAGATILPGDVVQLVSINPTMVDDPILIDGTVTNEGSLTIGGLRDRAVAGVTGSSSDRLVNNGTLATFQPNSYLPIGDTVKIVMGVPVSGAGTINIAAFTNLEFANAVAAGQTVMLATTGSFFISKLTIDDVTQFAAPIANAASGGVVVVTGPAYTTTSVALLNGMTSLTFLRGAQPVGALMFEGSYVSSQFHFATTLSGAGEQTTITLDRPVAPLTSDIVYRFFNKVDGTQFLTASNSEANSLASTRPDLVLEGTGLYAVDPAANDVNAVPVFRFFDEVHGTHFFTASASERDTLISTRSDLLYEPNSVFYDHAVQQSGDVPVYRFFETANGTHFYTADAGERNSILASRPDFVAEGIAFFAPSH